MIPHCPKGFLDRCRVRIELFFNLSGSRKVRQPGLGHLATHLDLDSVGASRAGVVALGEHDRATLEHAARGGLADAIARGAYGRRRAADGPVPGGLANCPPSNSKVGIRNGMKRQQSHVVGRVALIS